MFVNLRNAGNLKVGPSSLSAREGGGTPGQCVPSRNPVGLCLLADSQPGLEPWFDPQNHTSAGSDARGRGTGRGGVGGQE